MDAICLHNMHFLFYFFSFQVGFFFFFVMPSSYELHVLKKSEKGVQRTYEVTFALELYAQARAPMYYKYGNNIL